MTVYIFQYGHTGRFAYTPDQTGANLPRQDDQAVWLLRGSIGDVLTALPASGARQVITDLMDKGFHVYEVR